MSPESSSEPVELGNKCFGFYTACRGPLLPEARGTQPPIENIGEASVRASVAPLEEASDTPDLPGEERA
jgi:hypothetical protein